MNATPIQVDDAMKARLWTRTNAVYPNLSTTTGPAEFLLVPPYNTDPYLRSADEAPLFLGNVALMPVAMAQTPPWSQVESTALYLPPTSTGNPPLVPINGGDFSGGPNGATYTPAHGRGFVAK